MAHVSRDSIIETLESKGINTGYDRNTNTIESWYGRRYKLDVRNDDGRTATDPIGGRVGIRIWYDQSLEDACDSYLHEKSHVDIFPFSLVTLAGTFVANAYLNDYSDTLLGKVGIGLACLAGWFVTNEVITDAYKWLRYKRKL